MFAFTSCQPVQQEPETPKKVYTKVEIGMGFLDFHDLCGQPTDIGRFESARSKIDTYKYKGEYAKPEVGCSGTITFIDDKLDSISR